MSVFNQERLADVDEDLAKLVNAVGEAQDIDVAAGGRTVAQEQDFINRNVSHLRNPLSSLHVIVPGKRPKALAVDVTPYPVDWEDHDAFVALGAAFKSKADELGISITWGGDWGWDFDHFQKKFA